MAPRGGYRQPERRCGRCGRVDEIGRRATDDQPDICVNCYRLPMAVCGSCAKQRPCNHVADGKPICKNCSPRTTVECAHCGQARPPTTRWPEGPVCERCYTAALQRRGTCAGCGDERRLVCPPGPDATTCCDCAGVPPVGSTCSVCGREDKLYERGRCVSCSLARRAGEVMAGPEGTVPAALTGVHDAIVDSATPRKALNWLRSGAGAPILGAIAAGNMALTHAALDEHPRRAAADYVRAMLVAHGALPARDEALARLERWINDKVAGIDNPDHAKILHRFATWHTLRGQRRRASTSNAGPRTVTAHARNQINAAVALLDWTVGRDIDLGDLTQRDIDVWLAGPPSRRYARAFLAWTTQQQLTTDLTIRASPVRAGSALDSEERWHIARRLLHDDTLELVDRVTGSFVLLYAQPLTRIAVMTTDQIHIDNGTVSIRFASYDVQIPEPLATLVTTFAAGGHTSHTGIGATASSWLFAGHQPGRPITPSRLGERLTPLGIDARAGRRAALLQLASQLPAPVIADALGITATTATDWVKAAGGDWANYAADTARHQFAQPREEPHQMQHP